MLGFRVFCRPPMGILRKVRSLVGSSMFRVRWSDVERFAGELLELEPSCDPPRWRTKGWPDEAALTKLRAVAI